MVRYMVGNFFMLTNQTSSELELLIIVSTNLSANRLYSSTNRFHMRHNQWESKYSNISISL